MKKKVKTIIEIEHLESGQPRPYADSRYRARIRATRHGLYTDGKVVDAILTEKDALNIANRFVHSFKRKDPAWHESRLESLSKVRTKPGLKGILVIEWEVLIIQPYLD